MSFAELTEGGNGLIGQLTTGVAGKPGAIHWSAAALRDALAARGVRFFHRHRFVRPS